MRTITKNGTLFTFDKKDKKGRTITKRGFKVKSFSEENTVLVYKDYESAISEQLQNVVGRAILSVSNNNLLYDIQFLDNSDDAKNISANRDNLIFVPAGHDNENKYNLIGLYPVIK